MKKLLLALLVLLFFSISASAQMLWDKIYGPPQSHAVLSKMIALSNNDYLLVGNQASPIFTTYAVRTDVNGDTIWTRRYMPLGLAFYHINDAAEDSDGNLILVGEGGGSSGNYDGFILKLNSNGDTIWTKKSTTPQLDRYSNVIIGNDGTYIINCIEGGAGLIKKLSKSGNVQWSKPFSFSQNEVGFFTNSIKVQNGYLVFMGTNSTYPKTMGKVIKINEGGIEQNNFYNYATIVDDVTPKINGNLMVCGYSRLYEFNAFGDTLWSKLYKIGSNLIGLRGIKPTSDGNYIAVFDRSNGRDQDVGLIKLSPSGSIIKDTILYRFGHYEYSKDIVVDSNGDYVFAGYAQANNGQNRFFLAKHRKWNQVIDTGEGEDEKEPVSVTNLYPNPATNQITISSEDSLTGTFKLYDLQGKKIWQETVSNSTEKVIPMHSFSRGVYILKFYSENGSNFTRKVVKQ